MIYKYKIIKTLFNHDISNIIINYNIKKNDNKNVINHVNRLNKFRIFVNDNREFNIFYFRLKYLKMKYL